MCAGRSREAPAETVLFSAVSPAPGTMPSRCTVGACGLSISPGPGSVLRALSVRCRGKEASPHPAGEQAGLGEVTEGKQED